MALSKDNKNSHGESPDRTCSLSAILVFLSSHHILFTFLPIHLILCISLSLSSLSPSITPSVQFSPGLNPFVQQIFSSIVCWLHGTAFHRNGLGPGGICFTFIPCNGAVKVNRSWVTVPHLGPLLRSLATLLKAVSYIRLEQHADNEKYSINLVHVFNVCSPQDSEVRTATLKDNPVVLLTFANFMSNIYGLDSDFVL